MNWRRGAYAARERDFAAETSAERSADWVAAAAGCAQIAAAALAERADADDQAQVAAALAAAASRVEEAPADAAPERGPELGRVVPAGLSLSASMLCAWDGPQPQSR